MRAYAFKCSCCEDPGLELPRSLQAGSWAVGSVG